MTLTFGAHTAQSANPSSLTNLLSTLIDGHSFLFTSQIAYTVTLSSHSAHGLASCSSQKRTSAGHHCQLKVNKGANPLFSDHSKIIKSSQRKHLLLYLKLSKFKSNTCLSLPRNCVPGTFLALALKVLCPEKPLSPGTVCTLPGDNILSRQMQEKYKTSNFTYFPILSHHYVYTNIHTKI